MPLLDANGSTDRALRIRCRGEFADVALLQGNQTWAIHGTNAEELKTVRDLPVSGSAKFGAIHIERHELSAVVTINHLSYVTTWKGFTSGLHALVA